MEKQTRTPNNQCSSHTLLVFSSFIGQQYKIIELLAAASLRGVNITIIISETGYQESELQVMGFNILHRPTCKMQCAVIDQRIGWYGSVNLIGHTLPNTNVIRMTTSEFANVLIDALGL